MNRVFFYNRVRNKIFGGKLTQGQVDNMERILNEWERRGLTDLRWLAYMLATVYWETAHTMKPIKEYGGQSYLRKKKYWPYYGRGYVQLTWIYNYDKMGKLLGIDLVHNPDLAMKPEVAIWILFEGMLRAETGVGDFTNHSLEMYFNDKKTDWVGARRIINGTDRAREIAEIAKTFHKCLKDAIAAPSIKT